MEYVLFGRTGLRVSELCLGTMTFGKDWGWGASDEEARQIFDAFAEAGGTFIDTANYYTGGQSERLVGEFVHDERERWVIGTKYSLSMRPDDPNGGGNSRKSLVQSVEASLKRLQTDYVDVLWLHAWDFLTPPEEILRALDDLVRAGKALYVGVSDTPAWRVAQMNAIAELRGWSAFAGLQVQYNLAERDVERDLVPMANAFGMAVTAWSPLNAGLLTGKYTAHDGGAPDEGRKAAGIGNFSETKLDVARALDRVADDVGRSPSQVALAWLRQQAGTVIPIVGARKVDQVRENLACLDLTLSEDQMHALDEASAPDLGFPHDFLASKGVRTLVHGQTTVRALR